MAIREDGTIIKFNYSEGKAPVESVIFTDVNTNTEFYALPNGSVSLVDGGYVVIPTKYKVGDVRVDVKYSQSEYILKSVAVECEDPAYIASVKSIGYYSFVLDLSDCNKQTINCTIGGRLRSDASDIPLSLRLLKAPSGKLIKSKDGRLRCVHYEIDAGLPSGRKYSLRELQKRNPIQVGSYLGVIYWDGKGSNRQYTAMRIGNAWYRTGDNQLLRQYLNETEVKVIGTEPGYYVIDGTLEFADAGAFDSDAIGSHIAALELHKAAVGDEFSRWWWDGTSEPAATSCAYNSYITGNYQYIKGIRASIVQYGIGDGTKQSNVTSAGWYSINQLSKGEYSSIRVNVVDRAGAKPVLWVPGLPLPSTQPMLDESRPVAMAIDRNGTPIVTKVVSAKKKVVV